MTGVLIFCEQGYRSPGSSPSRIWQVSACRAAMCVIMQDPSQASKDRAGNGSEQWSMAGGQYWSTRDKVRVPRRPRLRDTLMTGGVWEFSLPGLRLDTTVSTVYLWKKLPGGGFKTSFVLLTTSPPWSYRRDRTRDLSVERLLVSD